MIIWRENITNRHEFLGTTFLGKDSGAGMPSVEDGRLNYWRWHRLMVIMNKFYAQMGAPERQEMDHGQRLLLG